MELPQTAETSEIVTTTQRLTQVVGDASKLPRVGLDIESNGFHRYPERVCLVQLAVPGSVTLIDPIAVPDLGPLGRLLADASVEKILHSADYDLRSLDHDWGFRVDNLFDTSVAAAFAGSARLGLGTLIQDYLGVAVPKSKRLQRADCTVRPLTPEAKRYAATDVLYLEHLRSLLVERLDNLSRLDWVAEECERLAKVRYRPRDPAWAFLSIKGSCTLGGRGLAVLRSLQRFRDREAVRRDRPPFKVIGDSVLVYLAANPDADLARVTGLGRFGRQPAAGPLRAAIRDGLGDHPVERPRRRPPDGPRPNAAERTEKARRLLHAKEWRTGLGRRLGLDPSLLWPASSLDRLAGRRSSLDEELSSVEVRAWQRREFGESLRTLLAGLDDGQRPRSAGPHDS